MNLDNSERDTEGTKNTENKATQPDNQKAASNANRLVLRIKGRFLAGRNAGQVLQEVAVGQLGDSLPSDELTMESSIPNQDALIKRQLKSSFKSRFLRGRAVKKYFTHSGRDQKQGLLSYPDEERTILRSQLARDIITNDGSTTFLVHSTDEENAQKIM
jgi:hypothetical protein